MQILTQLLQLPGGILYRHHGPDAWKLCRVIQFDTGSDDSCVYIKSAGQILQAASGRQRTLLVIEHAQS